MSKAFAQKSKKHTNSRERKGTKPLQIAFTRGDVKKISQIGYFAI